MFHYTTLLGSLSEEQAVQSLVSLSGGVNILINVGWDECCTLSKLEALKNNALSIDAILLTHPTISHLGAYAYACKFIPEFSSIPTYATYPVIQMGKTCMFDLYRSHSSQSANFDSLTTEEIEAYFSKINSIKYGQDILLVGKLNGICITAFAAGHAIGGTIWKIQKEQENIIYAVDWNHSKERHLNGAAFLQAGGTILDALVRPSTLICSAKNSTKDSVSKSKRELAFLSSIDSVLESGGSVLLPTDASARILEIVHIIESHWKKNKISYPILLCTKSGKKTFQYARSMLEWMSNQVVSEFEASELPFDLKQTKLCSNMEEYLKYSDTAKVVIASGTDLEFGFSAEIFADFCEEPSNLIIFTQSPEYKTVAADILQTWNASSSSEEISNPLSCSLQKRLNVSKLVPLEGGELQEYLQEQQFLKQREEERLALEIKNRELLEEAESESSEDEFEPKISPETQSSRTKVDFGVSILLSGDVYDYDVRNAKGKNRMFPMEAKRIRRDDYGEIINPEQYMISAEWETDEIEQTGKKSVTGEKRKWDQETQRRKDKLGDDEVERQPTKIVNETRNVNIVCKLQFIEFDGIHDSRSLQMILPQIRPRKIILIHGNEQETVSLAETLDQLPAVTCEIYYPPEGEKVNVSVDINAYDVMISASLANSLPWKVLSTNHSVTRISGCLKAIEDGGFMLEESDVIGDATMHVGDVKLPVLKRMITDLGYSAEFRGEGVLLCDNKVAIKKDGTGKIVVEGLAMGNFNSIRNVIYSCLATV